MCLLRINFLQFFNLLLSFRNGFLQLTNTLFLLGFLRKERIKPFFLNQVVVNNPLPNMVFHITLESWGSFKDFICQCVEERRCSSRVGHNSINLCKLCKSNLYCNLISWFHYFSPFQDQIHLLRCPSSVPLLAQCRAYLDLSMLRQEL